LPQDMFKAAEENEADTVEEIFKNGLHPDATDKFGNSVIVIAATMGSLDVVKSAVAAGCDVNKPASSGETALALAKKGLTHAIVRGGDKDRDKFGSVVDFLEASGGKDKPFEEDDDVESVAVSEMPQVPKSNDLMRPQSADIFRGGKLGVSGPTVDRPTTAKARLATAISKVSSLGAVSKVFGVFEKKGSTNEVLKLEHEVKGWDKAMKEIKQAEAKVCISRHRFKA